MQTCNDCFIGDYRTGRAKLIPASEFGVSIPGLVVIPENESRPTIRKFDYPLVNSSAEEYWQIHE